MPQQILEILRSKGYEVKSTILPESEIRKELRKVLEEESEAKATQGVRVQPLLSEPEEDIAERVSREARKQGRVVGPAAVSEKEILEEARKRHLADQKEQKKYRGKKVVKLEFTREFMAPRGGYAAMVEPEYAELEQHMEALRDRLKGRGGIVTLRLMTPLPHRTTYGHFFNIDGKLIYWVKPKEDTGSPKGNVTPFRKSTKRK